MATIEIGSSLGEGGGPVAVDARVFSDNAVVIGTEGSGKTSLGRMLVRSLLDSGSSVIAVDTTGDLVEEFTSKEGLSLRRNLSGAVPERSSIDLVALDLGVAGSLFSEVSGAASAEPMIDENRDLVAALLELIGYRPRRFSPEFVLLENILLDRRQHRGGVDLAALPSLVLQPPIDKIGVLELDSVIPIERRNDLAAGIMSLLETPSFARSEARNVRVESFLDLSRSPRAIVLTFADRSPKIRRFIVAALLAKLQTVLPDDATPLVLYFDEASDFFPDPTRKSVVSRLLLRALEGWNRYGASATLVTQQASDLPEEFEEFCETWLVGQTPSASERRRVIEELDLVNPPIDERALEEQLKTLRAGQFVLRSRHLDDLVAFQAAR